MEDLEDEGYAALLKVEDGGCVPVPGGVDGALGGGGHHQVPMAQARLEEEEE